MDSAGCLTRYRLVAEKKSLDGKEEKESKPRRRTYGEKDPNKDNKTILMVGQTGTGKSTLINAMVNYAIGVEFDDGVWFEIVEEVKVSDCESQTSEVTVYEIFGFEGGRLPYSLTLIDTPGYGNTRGIEKDEVVAKQLLELFSSSNGVCELDAVGVVAKADTNRKSGKLKYIQDSVFDLFHKDMKENLVFLMTYSTGLPPTNALKILNAQVHFLFNNCPSAKAWKTTQKGMKQFLEEFLTGRPTTDLKNSKGILETRIELKSCIAKLKKMRKKVKIDPVEESRGVSCCLSFINYLPPPFSALCQIYCSRAVVCNDCQTTCHHPPTIAPTAYCCEVMKKDEDGVKRCTICPQECTYDRHEKTSYRYEDVESDEWVEDFDLRRLVEKAYQHVEELEKSSLNPGSLSVHIHLDFLIEKLNEIGDKEDWVEYLEEMKKQAGEGIQEGMDYVQSTQ